MTLAVQTLRTMTPARPFSPLWPSGAVHLLGTSQSSRGWANSRSVSRWTGDDDDDDNDDDNTDDRCPKVLDNLEAPLKTALHCGFSEEEQKLMVCCPRELTEDPTVRLTGRENYPHYIYLSGLRGRASVSGEREGEAGGGQVGAVP